jgi:hypothetical protein
MSDAAQLPKTKMLVNLMKCIYNDLEKEAAAGTFLTYSESEILSWGRNEPENDINQFNQLKRLFHQFCSGFKHIGFKEEMEWRLALHMLVEYPDVQLIQFRDDKTPYIRVPLRLKCQDSPLKRIVVGPSQNKDQIVVSLRLELAKMGIQGVEVVPSKIPYRNW